MNHQGIEHESTRNNIIKLPHFFLTLDWSWAMEKKGTRIIHGEIRKIMDVWVLISCI